MLQEIAFQIAKRRISRGSAMASGAGERPRASITNYNDWRDAEMRGMYLDNFPAEFVENKDVLDFGCGDGGLSFMMVGLGARSCTGVDLGQKGIDAATSKVRDEPVSFICASNDKQVDMGDESVDVIVCFDVMEHIMEYESIMNEWHRLLRPGGRVLIHWQPYFHPYGHHGQDYLPLPWIHVIMNARKRTELCARIVDLPEFNAPLWDYDEDNNRINRFRVVLESKEKRRGFLNKLTMWKFERLCKKIGLSIEQRALSNFRGPLFVRAVSSLLTKIPRIREYFTANAVYVLSK